MASPRISLGLKFAKKPPSSTKPAPAKRKPIFGQDDNDDDDDDDAAPTRRADTNVETIAELDDLDLLTPSAARPSSPSRRDRPKSKNNAPPSAPPTLSARAKKDANVIFGDLSSTRESQKHAAAAQALDPTIYDYDAVYDSLKHTQQKKSQADADADAARRPKYMDNLLAAAAVRKRDALIAEEKKIAREREVEGDEFADKERFVTGAYRRQQEENRRIEEEERRREEEEERKRARDGGGMTAFYKGVLEKGEERHNEAMRAAEEMALRKKEGRVAEDGDGNGDEGRDDGGGGGKREADMARAMNQKGAAVAINEDGQVVDKRDLLRGGLNLAPKDKPTTTATHSSRTQQQQSNYDRFKANRDAQRGRAGAAASRQSVRERQTRMMEEQLEQALKRTRDDEAGEQERVERMVKSRKTEGEIEGARERYLRRKREAEEAKRAGGGK